MNILVAVASKHGSTLEIAQVIAEALQSDERLVSVRAIDERPSPANYDAAVIGSAVYAGNWMTEARQFVTDHRATLSQMPVWLFSSGPLGDEDPQPTAPPAQLDELMAETAARGHQIFVGKLDKSQLGLGERLIVRAVKAPYGDFRQWETIRAWARDVAAELEAVPA